jgi:hypothetical protein
MFPSLSIIVPHVLISSHDHLLFSIIIHSYQLQLLFINDDYFLLSSSLLLFIFKYYYHILYISHIIPMFFFHDIPMDFFVEQNPPGLAAGNRHGRGHSVPGALGESSFSVGKR